MKKTTLLILMLFISALGFSQVLNDAANWPNVAWNITGSYGSTAGLFEADPTVDSNFAFDDNQAGSGVANSIAAESSYMDLTGASVSGEIYVYVDFSYIYNHQNSETLALQYWDFDSSTWVTWDNLADTGSTLGDGGASTTNGNVYCGDVAHQVDYTSVALDISGFSATQLAGFRYRFYFNDNNIWARGFCISSPTIYSQSCPPVSNITLSGITDTAVQASWTPGGNETEWEVVVQPAGTGVPSGSGTVANTNINFPTAGLTALTSYEVYVRASCGGGEYSMWEGPVTFTTYAVPPATPTGVTCATGTGSYIFTEDFDSNIAGWTGNINTGGGSWEIPDGATSAGTGPSTAYSGSNFMNFEASGANPANPASIVTPEIDLTTATGDVELSFYMHAYGGGMGTLEVGVGTAATGPFTNEFTWVGQYQTSANQDWIAVGVDLTAYAGQAVYLEFRQTGTGAPTGDMSIDYVRVQACGTYCVAPSTLAATNITDTTADLSWVANNGETSWEYVVQPAGTGVPTGAGTVVNTTPAVQATSLTPDTAYEVYVRADCGGGFYSDWSYVYNFTTAIQTEFTVDCTVGPTNVTYCYGNNDTTMFTFTATDPTIYLTAVFNSGNVENNSDEIIVYDTDGTTILYQGYGNAGDLTGLEIQSSGDTIYIQVQSDGVDSCEDGATGATLDFDVFCTTCINPTATYSILPNCSVQNQIFEFYVEVEITDMGDATLLNIDDNMGGATQTASAPGTLTFGPYTNTVLVNFTVANANDPNCVITSADMTQDDCPPTTDALCQSIDAGDDIDTDCAAFVNGVDLDADFFLTGTSTTAYQLSSVSCQPQVNPGVPTNLNIDDRYSSVLNMTFDFCYFGNTYNQIVVGANGVVSFDTSLAGATCPWAFTASIPSPNLPTNAILGVYHDIHPGVGGDIEYIISGTAPNRTFTVNFSSVPHFSCNNIVSTTQIVLYETSNAIEINILEKPTCSSWNSGNAAAGLQNIDGTIGYFPPNRNTGPWSVPASAPESWRYVPAGPANYTFEWVDAAGNTVSTDSETTVYPTETTTYTAIVTYNQCDGTSASLSDDVVVTIDDTVDLGAPAALEACDEAPNDGDAVFDLTTQDLVIQNGIVNATVTYYTSQLDAEGGVNAITDPTTYLGTDGETIYTRLDLDASPCFGVGQFDLIVNPAPEVLMPDTTKFFCEDLTLQPTITNATDLSGTFTYEWYDDGVLIATATGDSYVLVADGTEEGVFTVVVTDQVTGCSTSTNFNVTITGNITAEQPDDIVICDDISNDGYAEFDLTSQDATIINGQPNTVVTYYLNDTDAQAGANPLTSPFTNTEFEMQTIVARLEETTSGCTDFITFDIFVYNTPILDFEPYYDVCSNGITATTLTPNILGFSVTDPGVTFTWSLDGTVLANETGSTLDVLDAGLYAVEVTTENCTNYFEVLVEEADDCFIPQGISPGGTSPGQNDTFDLDGFEVSKLQIFNRLGAEIYTFSDYTDEWHGQDK
ncbi:fibronectin type III domain-containing protein, partial [Neptunitalea lumnitzerae]|uniref:fibronectin type III domain-containing protein n=1 Tax=Neptunitalea lumnitzerae TaxID=2965509 RepID=UPI00248F7EEE